MRALSPAERRAVTLLGRSRAGHAPSQHLALFEWLCTSKGEEGLPSGEGFTACFPSASSRLKGLILDALRLLHADRNVDARLRTHLDRIAQLTSLMQVDAARREAEACLALALQWSRHEAYLQCLAAIASQPGMADWPKEEEALARLRHLMELRHAHRIIEAEAQGFLLMRDPEALKRVEAAASLPSVANQLQRSGPFLEQALAFNTQGMHLMCQHRMEEALAVLKWVMASWAAHPEWQADQPALLLSSCKFWLRVCFNVRRPWEEVQQLLQLMPDFSALNQHTALQHQRTLFLSHMALLLNAGQLDSLESLLPQVEAWLRKEGAALTQAQRMPFLINFAVAFMLRGTYQEAYRQARRNLLLPGRTVRTDIQDFALVLQSIAQFELGEDQLSEHMTRSGRRHFKRRARDLAFEDSVLRFLDFAIRHPSPRQRQKPLSDLISELEKLESTGKVPPLGRNEVLIWARSKAMGVGIEKMFLLTVREHRVELEASSGFHQAEADEKVRREGIP